MTAETKRSASGQTVAGYDLDNRHSTYYGLLVIQMVSYEFVRGQWRAEEICEIDECGKPHWREVQHPPRIIQHPKFDSQPTNIPLQATVML